MNMNNVHVEDQSCPGVTEKDTVSADANRCYGLSCDALIGCRWPLSSLNEGNLSEPVRAIYWTCASCRGNYPLINMEWCEGCVRLLFFTLN